VKALEDRFRTVFVGFTAPLGGSFVNYDLDRFNGGNRLQLNQVLAGGGRNPGKPVSQSLSKAFSLSSANLSGNCPHSAHADEF
jgi:hypothetical protein